MTRANLRRCRVTSVAITIEGWGGKKNPTGQQHWMDHVAIVDSVRHHRIPWERKRVSSKNKTKAKWVDSSLTI